MNDAQQRAQQQALLQRLEASLGRGYHRVALRHFHMLTQCGYAVPGSMEARCKAIEARLNQSVSNRIRQQVDDWCSFVGLGQPKSPASQTPSLLPRKAPRGGIEPRTSIRGPWPYAGG